MDSSISDHQLVAVEWKREEEEEEEEGEGERRQRREWDKSKRGKHIVNPQTLLSELTRA